MTNPTEQYFHDRDERIRKLMSNQYEHVIIKEDTSTFMNVVHRTNYVKNFTWLGRPILQLPTDLMALQEIIWQVKPDYIIETGVAFGGLTVFLASMLEAVCPLSPACVLGIDIEIRNHNKQEILLHPLWNRIKLIEGSSTARATAQRVRKLVADGENILVVLDSDHSHEHVLQELRIYAPLVSMDSYIVVMDTSIEYLDPKYIPEGKPWGKGNNPLTAVREFREECDEFIADLDIEDRILLTSAPYGWLKRIKEV